MAQGLPVLAGVCCLVAGTASALSADQEVVANSCLYGMSVGDSHGAIDACEASSDPLHVAQDPAVRRAIAALGLANDLITFHGCAKTPFQVIAVPRTGSQRVYRISYPIEAGADFLAPTIHELAHAFQFDNGLGPDGSGQAADSMRVELSADFLVGYVFSHFLQGTDEARFQANLSLIGLYHEKPAIAHGRPEQRVSAFRIGLVSRGVYADLAPAAALRHFDDYDYAKVLFF